MSRQFYIIRNRRLMTFIDLRDYEKSIYSDNDKEKLSII